MPQEGTPIDDDVITLPPDHPLRDQFLKTDQTFDAYLTLVCQFMSQMPCDNAPGRQQ